MTVTLDESVYTAHDRAWRDCRYLYPVLSRRSRGLSLGVDLTPDGRCNFGCVYCQIDRTKPARPAAVDLSQLAEELARIVPLCASGELFQSPPLDRTPGGLRRFNDVALSGSGEPTASPHFPAACAIIADALRDLPAVKIVIITNATRLDQPYVYRGLQALARRPHEVWAKLDAGTQQWYDAVCRSPIPLQRVIDNLMWIGRERPLVIQSMFFTLNDQPPPQAEVDAYVRRIEELRAGGCQLDRVQAYTVARRPAESSVGPVSHEWLEDVADRVRRAGVPAEVFGAAG
ncbi:MAG TPA: radical SAM protein [Tepidisphaeraceae bacterium]|nr:radical SAM protein [Tepidisphaeraceae bacterium]